MIITRIPIAIVISRSKKSACKLVEVWGNEIHFCHFTSRPAISVVVITIITTESLMIVDHNSQTSQFPARFCVLDVVDRAN